MNHSTDSTKKGRQDEQSEEAVNRGKAAIESQKITDPKEPEVREKENKEDANSWRNEG